jgi:sarcosine oxidase
VSQQADVIVVGLGAMGAQTCLALARRGVSVVGIDQFHPPHPFGSTHGDTRITRLAIGEGSQYVPLVRRSNELWRELEEFTGEHLLSACGGVVLGFRGSEFLRRTIESARRFGIEHEVLGDEELRRRLPMFAIPDGTEGYYEPAAGYLRPEPAVAAALALAERLGARLRFGERVSTWSASDVGVSVMTEAGRVDADRLVMCAGAWIGELYPDGRELFTVYRQLLYWFPIERGFAQLRELPVFIWDLAVPDMATVHPPSLYGFPAIDGPSGGLKLGIESYEQPVSPDATQRQATEAEAAAMYRRYVASTLPWLGQTPVRSASCLYTTTASGDFVIDRHPERDCVTIVSACSGHGFKHTPAIGEAIAQLLTDGRSELDLTPFALTRAGVRQ